LERKLSAGGLTEWETVEILYDEGRPARYGKGGKSGGVAKFLRKRGRILKERNVLIDAVVQGEMVWQRSCSPRICVGGGISKKAGKPTRRQERKKAIVKSKAQSPVPGLEEPEEPQEGISFILPN